MVQVDIFWSFGIGAGLAASAAKQIREKDDPFEDRHFVKTLVYLSCFFVPSGAILLWAFPEWETMQAGTYATIPAWLVGLFTLTNVTQGILGYWLAWRAIRAGNERLAWIYCGLGYFAMFFILVHGWDGTGWQRFFYSCSWWGGGRECAAWAPGTHQVLRWAFLSPVAWTLYAMGLVMLPLLFFWMSAWIQAGDRVIGARPWPQAEIVKILARLAFGHLLGAAIAASLLIHWLGWPGAVVFAVAAWFLLLRRGSLTDTQVTSLISPPVG